MISVQRSNRSVDAAVGFFFFNFYIDIIIIMIVSNMPFRLASINKPTRILQQHNNTPVKVKKEHFSSFFYFFFYFLYIKKNMKSVIGKYKYYLIITI